MVAVLNCHHFKYIGSTTCSLSKAKFRLGYLFVRGKFCAIEHSWNFTLPFLSAYKQIYLLSFPVRENPDLIVLHQMCQR